MSDEWPARQATQAILQVAASSVCVCVCVCVCVRARVHACMRACVRVCVWHGEVVCVRVMSSPFAFCSFKISPPAVDCSNLPFPTTGVQAIMDPALLQYNFSVPIVLNCAPGFVVNGNEQETQFMATCQANGVWNVTAFGCTGKIDNRTILYNVM